MRHMTPAHLASVLGGRLYVPETIRETEITAVTTDSRQVTPGCLFIPLRGARADGHDFIPQVMADGALMVLTEKAETCGHFPCLLVDSAAEALKTLAADYLREMAVPVVAVTGSVGKTSTKEMIAAVLGAARKTLKTLGNFNNELGLPLTICRLREGDEAAVLEMGISHFGDMTVLAAMANPDIAVITNIGTCHLENLIDRDGVFRAKTEIFDFLKPGGRVVLNGDDDKLAAVTAVNGRKPVFFGLNPHCDYYADHIESCGFQGSRCVIHTPDSRFEADIPIPGSHAVSNALAACAVGRLMGLDDETIRRGIASVEALAGRFRIIETGGMTVIDDCYNANPMSMKASLSLLTEAKGRRAAVLGSMGELGANEEALHREVGAYMAAHTPDVLLTAGSLGALMADELKKAGTGCDIRTYPDTDSLAAALPSILKPGDTVLVKASHFMHFEIIVRALTALSDI